MGGSGTPREPVTVVVVDDHVVFREGLRALLARVVEIEVLGEAAGADEAVAVTEKLRPDVVLMDLNLSGGDGVAATRAIVGSDHPAAVLVLTMYADDRHLQAALGAGARGYLLKDANPDAIVRAILAVHSGQVIFDQGIAAQVLVATSTAGTDRPLPSLSEREFEILDMIARGHRNEAIAVQIGLSIKTVQNYVSSILLKLGARDRANLVVQARDAGLGVGERSDRASPRGR